MMKCLRSLFLGLCVATAATSAIAQDGSTTASEFTAADATLSYLSGAAVGTVAGLGTAYAIIASADCGESNMCVGDAAVGILGGFTAFTFATPLGIYWYGEYANLQGSYWSAFWGTAAGAAAGTLVSFATKGADTLFMPLLATPGRVAYSASTPDSAEQARTRKSMACPWCRIPTTMVNDSCCT